jgi:hypothetical protein
MAQNQDGSSTSVSASLRLDYFSSSRELDDVSNVLGASLDVDLTHRFGDNQRLEVEGRLSREDLLRDDRQYFRLINGFWLARWERVDLRIGQQKIRWGKADGINPTDFFTPIDYTVLLPLEEDRYLSVPAVRTDVQVGKTSTVSLVVSPNFTPTRLPWPSYAPVTVVEDEPSGWRRPQVGLRLLQVLENLDWSLSAFRGFSTVPVLSFVDIGPQGEPRYQRYYPQSTGFGMDVAHNLGHWGFRAELAYSELRGDGRQPVASNYFLVTGVDRSIDNWNINVQALLRHTPHYESTNAFANPLQELAATENAIVYNQQQRVVPGLTMRVGTSWLHETLQAEFLTIAYFRPANFVARPLLTYALSDVRKIRAGAEYYSGPDRSYFGLLKRNRTAFVEFQQYFQ